MLYDTIYAHQDKEDDARIGECSLLVADQSAAHSDNASARLKARTYVTENFVLYAMLAISSHRCWLNSNKIWR